MAAYCFRNADWPTRWVCAEGWEGSSIHMDASSARIRDHSVHWSAANGWECWHHMEGGGNVRYEKLDAEPPSIMPRDAPDDATVKATGGLRVWARRGL